jgi:adenylosuccinate lyase
MSLFSLTSLSPLDGRYAGRLDALRPQFSEYGLIRRRLQVELEWLKALAAEPHFAEIPAFSQRTLAELAALLADFGPQQAAEVKEIEAVTNHDVKALEYWIGNVWRTTPKSCASPSSFTSRVPPRISTILRTP